jgi:hypothetical protein
MKKPFASYIFFLSLSWCIEILIPSPRQEWTLKLNIFPKRTNHKTMSEGNKNRTGLPKKLNFIPPHETKRVKTSKRLRQSPSNERPRPIAQMPRKYPLLRTCQKRRQMKTKYVCTDVYFLRISIVQITTSLLIKPCSKWKKWNIEKRQRIEVSKSFYRFLHLKVKIWFRRFGQNLFFTKVYKV